MNELATIRQLPSTRYASIVPTSVASDTLPDSSEPETMDTTYEVTVHGYETDIRGTDDAG